MGRTRSVILRPVFVRLIKLTAAGSNHDSVRPSNNPYATKATDMAGVPTCTSCNLERMLISIKPGRNRHDVRAYECPACHDVFRLVIQREPLVSDDPIDVVFDSPALKAGAR